MAVSCCCSLVQHKTVLYFVVTQTNLAFAQRSPVTSPYLHFSPPPRASVFCCLMSADRNIFLPSSTGLLRRRRVPDISHVLKVQSCTVSCLLFGCVYCYSSFMRWSLFLAPSSLERRGLVGQEGEIVNNKCFTIVFNVFCFCSATVVVVESIWLSVWSASVFYSYRFLFSPARPGRGRKVSASCDIYCSHTC